MDEPLIVSLRMDENSQIKLDALRKQYFPSDRNFLSAHLTMFHALRGDLREQIIDDLMAESGRRQFGLRIDDLRFLGRGVAINVASEQLSEIHRRLAQRWWSMLTAQDRQPFRPHVTIQNKVDPAIARQTFEMLKKTWNGMDGMAMGFELWRYCGGPWESVRSIAFSV